MTSPASMKEMMRISPLHRGQVSGSTSYIFWTTVFAFDAGETIVEDAAFKIAVDHLFHISTEETVLGGKALVIDLLKFLKMILNALVIFGILRLSRAIYGGDVGHRLSCS